MAKYSPEMVLKAEAARKRKAAANKIAAKQAQEDALRSPTEVYRTGLKPGEQVPLHVANSEQRRHAASLRDEVREASLSAARAVKDTLEGARKAQKRKTATTAQNKSADTATRRKPASTK